MRIVFAKYPAHATALLLVLASVAAGCGSAHKRDDLAQGDTLTIYTSLPRHGVSARAGEAVSAGERLGLADAHGHAGGRRIRLVELDDSVPDGVSWDPSAVEANAKRAAADPTTIAYIGELDFGGSAISVPVTNSKGLLQVSPGDGLTSLTQVQPGGPKTSPVRYYPSGNRSFVRLVPTDLAQVETLLAWMAGRNADHIAIVHDDRLFGREMSAQAAASASRRQVSIVDVEEARGDATSYLDLAQRIAATHPNGIAYLGVGGPQADLLMRTLADAMPGVPLYGAGGLATPQAGLSRLPPVDVIGTTFPAAVYGAAGRRVLDRLTRELGAPVQPEALYGYEAMRVVIDALNAAARDSDDRERVARAALASGPRPSPLGTFTITPTGDASPTRLAAYRLVHGRLQYQGARETPHAGP